MRQLLFSVTIKDCRVDTFRAGGNGGQHQNKTDSGVRIVHRASGAVGESREERSQLGNKRKAFRKMAESKTFRIWARAVALGFPTQAEIERKVDEMLSDENLKIEYL
jgi:protein subunit release factor A